ncbi:MAG TPA: aconitase X catalytic domain-containing protein [Alphaproteobacteria bacterium]|nr:aconitase X catalytic domain-containing protein [Alphaproteobacteria bacterium]
MLALTDDERLVAGGSDGTAMAMRIVAEAARLLGARRLIPVASAHIDGCLYHGDSGVRFAERLVEGGARVAVPATLNVGALDLLRPENVRLPAGKAAMARRLMDAYLALGCQPTWTCAPYQAGHRPMLGEDVAWGESNAVAFANSVLGARTNRYGDFLDIACALTARAPETGLHLTENRRATVVVDTGALSAALKDLDAFYPVLGAWYGAEIGSAIGVIDGLPGGLSEDRLKALGAAAASTGAVALFHVAGTTPEAPTAADALGRRPPERTIRLTPDMVRAARDRLSTRLSSVIDAVAVGSPHFSLDEVAALERLMPREKLAVPFYVCTGRHVLDRLAAEGRIAPLERRGVVFVADTCVVVTPILKGFDGVLMTNSGKFAQYAPANTGYGVIYGSLADCVASAATGRVARDEGLWT